MGVPDVAADPVGIFGELQPGLGQRQPERLVVFVGVDLGSSQAVVSLFAIKLDRVH
jgi:hypothetical protein